MLHAELSHPPAPLSGHLRMTPDLPMSTNVSERSESGTNS